MPINDYRTRELIAEAQRELNKERPVNEVAGFLARKFPEYSEAMRQEALNLATDYYRSVQLLRQHIAGRGITGQQMKIADIGSYLGMETTTGKMVGIRVYFSGLLEGDTPVRGSVVMNVHAGTNILGVQRRAYAAIASGAIPFPHHRYGFKKLSVSIQSMVPYERQGAFTLDTAPVTPDHPNPYTIPEGL